MRARFTAVVNQVRGNQGKCLDIGGFICSEVRDPIKAKGFEYTSIDIRPSPESILMDARDMKFPDNTFDVATIGCVLMYINERDKVLSEAFRVLKKGGYLVVLEDGSSILGDGIKVDYVSTMTIKDGTNEPITHKWRYSFKSLVEDVQKAGFMVYEAGYNYLEGWALVRGVKE